MQSFIVADIGGTNARFALARVAGTSLRLSHVEAFGTREFESFDACLESYLRLQGFDEPLEACLAAAGPVVDNAVNMTNLHWQVDGKALARLPGLERVRVVNDFVAMACASQLRDQISLLEIKAGRLLPRHAHLVLGPGTGLGVAALVPVNGKWLPVPGEGGHFGCPAYSVIPDAVWRALVSEHDHLVLELLLSGRGLVNLHRALRLAHGEADPGASASEITQAAVGATDRRCVETVELLCAVLGCVARDFALVYGAAGGVYLAGGILPRITDNLRVSRFGECFIDHPTHGEMLEGIPVHLIREPHAAMLGAARWYLDWGATNA